MGKEEREMEVRGKFYYSEGTMKGGGEIEVGRGVKMGM